MEWFKEKKTGKKLLAVRALVCVLVIAAGLSGMKLLSGLKKPPAENRVQEKKIRVETMAARPGEYPVSITGHGELMALDAVEISPEVGGRVVYVHSSLEPGERVKQGELLFGIDSRDYSAAAGDLEATFIKWENTVLRLKKQMGLDRSIVELSRRKHALAERDYIRIKKLFENSGVGTLTGVERAEQAMVTARENLALKQQSLELLPLRIREAESSRESFRAKLKAARINIDRCRVVSPFSGRIRRVSLEKGQFVTPGHRALTLADDSLLEMHVALDSRDLKKWLEFSGSDDGSMWFPALKDNPCRVWWTEDDDGEPWKGKLSRVISFNPETRTVIVAVRVSRGMNPGKGFPLVEGMYCRVSIPGRSMSNVTRIPRWAVSYKGDVYISENGRLRTIRVDVVRLEEDSAYVSGLTPGDMVITTRLVDPLENALLEL